MEINVFGFEINVFAVVSGLFGLGGYVPYVRSILKKEVRPERTSWITWLILDVLLSATYIQSGAKGTAALLIAFTIGAFVIVMLSIRYGKWTGVKDSIPCFAASAIGIALWWTLSSAEAGLYCFIGALTVSMWPLLKEAYKNPWEESLPAWIMWFTGAFFSICALGEPSSWKVPIASIPMAYLILNIPVTLTIIKRRKIKRRT